ncbi:MAG: FkbM family methyltransferase [bacterium]
MLKDLFTWQFARCAGDVPSYLKVIVDAHRWNPGEEKLSEVRLRHPFPCRFVFRTNTSDMTVVSEVFVHQAYAIELPEPPCVILDFGANIGLASLYFARKYPNATIHSFEPVPENFALLQSQCSLNGLCNVHAYPFGLSDRDQVLTLSMDKPGQYGGVHQAVETRQQARSFDVPLRDVRNVLSELGGASIDLLKIDIEGAEHDILRAMEDRLPLVRGIVGEFHAVDGDADKLWTLVEFLRKTHVVDIEKVFSNNCLVVRAWSRRWLKATWPGWSPLRIGFA